MKQNYEIQISFFKSLKPLWRNGLRVCKKKFFSVRIMDKKVHTFCLNFFEKDDCMLSVGRRQIDALREVGLLKDKKTGLNVQDPNYTVLNKFHKARAKTYAVVETPEILAFLECWDRCNLQEITARQFNQLVEEKRLNESNI